MKFPKSLHADGWSSHIDTTKSGHAAPSLALKPSVGKRIGRDAPLHGTPSQASVGPTTYAAAADPFVAAPAASRTSTTATHAATVTPRTTNTTPWLIGAGVGLAAIGLAVTMSRNTTTTEPVAPPAVVSQAATSPEDAQLRSEPPSAGPVTAAAEATQPAPSATVAAATPAVEPPAPKVAAVTAATLPVTRSEPAAAPRTSAPRADVLAQASPQPLQRRDAALQPLPGTAEPVSPAASVTPVAPAVTPPVLAAAPLAAPAAVPEAAAPLNQVAPVTAPLAQAEPQPQSPVAAVDDTAITGKVRTALASDSTLAAVPIAVSTDQGVVKLEGQAPDAPTRERATVVASATSGVKSVDNRLTLPPVASLASTASGS